MRKIAQKIHFLALEVEKTTSRCFFGQKSIFPKNDIFYFWIINFSRKILQALEKTFFDKIEKVLYLSFHTHFQVSKNI